ncbi:hypothetical protein LVQ62_07960 [Allobranchiibius sp. GilTou73]|nr:hypothetical protein LVQ62_07960 [Allobranchiibius sp. GilTou73]
MTGTNYAAYGGAGASGSSYTAGAGNTVTSSGSANNAAQNGSATITY